MSKSAICHVHAACLEGTVQLTWLKGTEPFQTDTRRQTADHPWSFRILRRVESAFRRGEDYAEYFMGGAAAATRDAEILFEGELTPDNGRRFEWIDASARHRTTYSYFVQALSPHPGRCVGPVGVRGVDPEIYWTYERLNAELDELVAASHGLARVDSCGFTGAGRPIPRLQIGKSGRRLVLIGLIHPGESGPELIVPALRRLLETRPELFESARVLAIPSVNLDGRQRVAEGTPWYLRTTPGGVDLNRNFPADWETVGLEYGLNTADPRSITYRGAAPGGAHETRAVMAALTQSPPDCLVSYHALASICSLPALVARASAEDESYQRQCRTFVEAMGKGFFPGRPYEDKWLRPGCSVGSLPLWVYQQFHVPAFDMEFLSDDPAEHPQIVRDQTDRAMLAKYQDFHTQAIAALLETMKG